MTAMKTSRPTMKRSRPMETTSDNGSAPSSPGTQPIAVPMVAEPTLGQILSELHKQDPAATHHDIAAQITERLKTTPDGWNVALPAITEFVRNRRRNHVHALERRAFDSKPERTFEPGDGTKPARSHVQELTLAQLADLVDERVKIPGVKDPKLYGDVTVDEWRLRAARLEEQISRDQTSVDMCERIVALLESKRCKTIRQALRKGAKT